MIKKILFLSQIVFSGTLALALLFPFSSVHAQVTTEIISPSDLTGQSGPLVSENWAGYTAENQGPYEAVGGSWVMPQSAGPSTSGEATWVGLGGFGQQDLLQVGTLTIINSAGVPQYYAWYEMLPSNPVAITLQVKPGDSMSASIVPLSTGTDQWLITIQNNTTGKFFQSAVTYHSLQSSAEWIEEVPTGTSNGSLIPLSNFGSVTFTNAWVVQNGVTRTISGAGGNQMYMLNFDSDTAEAVPSELSNNGTSFSVTRTESSFVPRRSVPVNSIGRWYRITITE